MHKSFEILPINIATARLSDLVSNAIGGLLHYTKNSLSSPCTTLYKHEQKDKSKSLVEFPDHIWTDYGYRHSDNSYLPSRIAFMFL